MKIVVDKKIPFIKGLLEPVAEVSYLEENEISRDALTDTDAIIIRSRTICDSNLLEGTKVRFIGTVTTGHDHIDSDYCEFSNIKWINASGCNSYATAQYVTSALILLSEKYDFRLSEKTLGIIGAGQAGQKVERNARLLGMNVLLNDPLRARDEGEKNFCSLERLLNDCDIITFHTALEKEGPEKTLHMADPSFFSRLRKNVFIINTSRGSIIDNEALKQAMKSGKVIDSAIDCWENEPDIDTELLEMCHIATPHIAGFSFDGKANAVKFVIEHLHDFFDLRIPLKAPELPKPENGAIKVPAKCKDKIEAVLLHTYNPLSDTEKLKKNPGKFEQLRDKYAYRREYKAFRVLNLNNKEADIMRAFGFQVPAHLSESARDKQP